MEKITVKTLIDAPLQKVWEYWTNPEHITKWNKASEEWLTSKAENELKEGGKFKYKMEAKDGSAGFDFEGKYQNIEKEKLLEYELTDGRKVKVTFTEKDGKSEVEEIFDPEEENSIEVQKEGWQSILDHFKNYSEKQ